MLINLRNALMAGTRLPYDAEVEYLESTGTQWIDTGIVPDTQDIRVEITYANGAGHLFGSRLSSSFTTNQLWSAYASSTTSCRCDWVGSNTNISVDSGAKTIVFASNTTGSSITYNGAATTGGVKVTNNLSMVIFGVNTNGTITAATQMTLYSFKVWKNGVLVRDYIPVRKGTTGELYDRVSGKFAERHGDFVVGPDVVPVEYIESHGTEWIDTGVVPSGQTKWELDVMFPNVDGFRPMGAIATNPTRRFVIARELGRTVYSISFGSYDNTQNGINSGIRRLCVIDAPNFTWSIGARSGTFTEGTFDISGIGSICLFVRKRNSGYDYLNDGSRVHRSTLYTSGSRIQDLLPVRVGTDATSWEGAMMDVLTRRTYRNQGTGAFGYGNDLRYPIPAA